MAGWLLSDDEFRVLHQLRPISPDRNPQILALCICTGGTCSGVIGWGVAAMRCPPRDYRLRTDRPARLLRGWRHRVSTVTQPTSGHLTCSLTALVASEAFTCVLFGVLFTGYLYSHIDIMY